MHIDRFIARNQPTWDRLAYLTKQARRRPNDLSDAELEELVQLYQRTSAQLSQARTYFSDTTLTSTLTRLVADARAVIYGKRARTARSIVDFFAFTFPAAVWQIRRAILASALLLLVPVVVMIVWLTNDPAALDASASPEQRQQVVDDAFESYYSENPSAQFATTVGVNNIAVSFIAFGMGALFVVGGALILIQNGLHIGEVGAWMTAAGQARLFWTLIAPHGLLELTSIVLAAAAGIHIGWTLISPGDRTRIDALSEEGRRSAAVVLGLVLFFAIAATIEGFITGSALPIEIKVGVGGLAWVTFVLYVVVQGRTALALGHTGQLGHLDRGWDTVATPDATPTAVVGRPGDRSS